MGREPPGRPPRLGPVGVLVVVVCLAAACGGEQGPRAAAPTTAAPTTTSPTTTAAAGAGAPATSPSREASSSGAPCDAQTLLQVMKAEGGQFDVSPAALAAMTPTGPPTCDRGFARQTFAGPPDDPGPFDALFGLRPPARTGWGLVSVNCESSVSSGQRQMC